MASSTPPLSTRPILDARMVTYPALLGSDAVVGAAVFDERGLRVGAIDRLIIEAGSGRVFHAVVTFPRIKALRGGGHRVPWCLLTHDPELGGFRLEMARIRAEAALRAGGPPMAPRRRRPTGAAPDTAELRPI